LSVGEFYKRLVVDPPRNYPDFYQEVKDLLLMAKDDYPHVEDLPDKMIHRNDILEGLFFKRSDWFRRWFGTSIETTEVKQFHPAPAKWVDERKEDVEEMTWEDMVEEWKWCERCGEKHRTKTGFKGAIPHNLCDECYEIVFVNKPQKEVEPPALKFYKELRKKGGEE